MLRYLTDLFTHGFDTKEIRRLPPPRRDQHIGTEERPYKLRDINSVRRDAIKSGVLELQQVFMMTMSAEDALKLAIDKKRKRLILIRTHHKNKASCARIHSDVLWMYDYYKLKTSKLKFECSL